MKPKKTNGFKHLSLVILCVTVTIALVTVVSDYSGKLTFAIGAEGIHLQIDGSRK